MGLFESPLDRSSGRGNRKGRPFRGAVGMSHHLSLAWLTGKVSRGWGGAWKSNSARMQELLPVTRGQLV